MQKVNSRQRPWAVDKHGKHDRYSGQTENKALLTDFFTTVVALDIVRSHH